MLKQSVVLKLKISILWTFNQSLLLSLLFFHFSRQPSTKYFAGYYWNNGWNKPKIPGIKLSVDVLQHLNLSNSTDNTPTLNNVSNLKTSIFHEICRKIFNLFLTIRKIMTCPSIVSICWPKEAVNFYFTTTFRFWCLQFQPPWKTMVKLS